ncbi:hypothetical protein RI129_002347 [Pyrocoelia pectoralis]|uniref:Uncharacterized protein n=1 Tax=Pyrocoelia pectoralis TaxID=417401 RepID=A0AAN7VF53_9COLE
MWIRIDVLLCCILATTLATNEPRSKKKDDSRGKRTLDYSISHNHNPPSSNFRLERRISPGFPISQVPQYPLFHPVQKPVAAFRKSRPNAPAPPYAVQMEPVAHYSQRDPLYDASLTSLGSGNNDIKGKDQLKEHSHNSRVSYAYPPAKHVVERPIYIKEPEPIIEIIIKESNITLPPLPTPPVTIAPRKKEHVQVFYVKYQKNPNAYGKESIVYDKPIPALTPHVIEETEPAPHPLPHYEALNTATLPPPPSTTLRAIVKPESETYHADKGIHITFGKTVNEQRKRSNADPRGEPALEPSPVHAQPQARQFNPFPSQPLYPNRPHENSHGSQFNDYRNAPPPTSFKQSHFNRGLSRGPSVPGNPQSPVTRPPPPNFTNPPFQSRPQTSFNSQQIPHRQPVAYQPFDQIRPQQPQIQFSRTHSHFPVNPQNQQFNNGFQLNQQSFQNPQRQQDVNSQYHQAQPTFPPAQNSQPVNHQHFTQHHQPSHIHQQTQQHIIPQQQSHIPIHHNQISQQPHHNAPQPQHPPPSHFSQNIHNNQHAPLLQHQQNLHFLSQSFPQQHTQQQVDNNELLRSIPKYEQHVSVNIPPQQSQKPTFQQPQPQISHHQEQANNFHTNQDYSHLIQQQFKQNNVIQTPQLQKSTYFHQSTYQTTPKPVSTTPSTTTSTTTTERRLTEKDLKDLNIELPDEVPEDLREQLLSSGILKNAQISVLDYDKIGDTSIADLPPDQLANFFSAGGAQLGAASENVPVAVRKNGEFDSSDREISDRDMEESESSPSEVKVPVPVEMKVVRYDPDSSEGKQVPEAYIQDGATQLDPVSLEDQQYTRYLPVKVNGAAFPIPDVAELRGRSITSVVVLAPVDLNVEEVPRKVRDVSNNKSSRHLAALALKNLIKDPSTENFKDWLDKENKTVAEKQAVILLVTGNSQPNAGEKEIFMYDLTTQTVNKLSGELSSAFVDAAETNSGQGLSPLQGSSSNVVETRIPYPNSALDMKDISHDSVDLEEGASEYFETKIPVIDPDSLPEASEQLERFVDISGMPIHGDLVAAASSGTKEVSVSSGYSKTGSSKLLHS